MVERAPVFIINGTNDRHTPLERARALYDRAAQPKQFWAVEGAVHEDLHAFAGREYEARVLAFLSRHLRGASTKSR